LESKKKGKEQSDADDIETKCCKEILAERKVASNTLPGDLVLRGTLDGKQGYWNEYGRSNDIVSAGTGEKERGRRQEELVCG